MPDGVWKCPGIFLLDTDFNKSNEWIDENLDSAVDEDAAPTLVILREAVSLPEALGWKVI